LELEYSNMNHKYNVCKEVEVEHTKKIFSLRKQENHLLATYEKLQYDNEYNEQMNTDMKLNKQKLTDQIAQMKANIDEALTAHSYDAMKQVILNMCLLYLWNDPDYIKEEDINIKGKIGGYAAL